MATEAGRGSKAAVQQHRTAGRCDGIAAIPVYPFRFRLGRPPLWVDGLGGVPAMGRIPRRPGGVLVSNARVAGNVEYNPTAAVPPGRSRFHLDHW